MEHLLRGADAFRNGQFSVALVEFRFAQEQDPSGEANWYAAAALVKLHRSDEALEAFSEAAKRAPGARDALFDFYEALACYDARLYSRAELLLAGIGPRAGPHLAQEASKLRVRLEPVLSGVADPSAAEWYRTEAARQREAGRPSTAALFESEAASVASHRTARLDAGQQAGGERRP